MEVSASFLYCCVQNLPTKIKFKIPNPERSISSWMAQASSCPHVPSSLYKLQGKINFV